jgi:hypothetical protein
MPQKPKWMRIHIDPQAVTEAFPVVTGLVATETDRFFVVAQYVTMWREDEINGEYGEVPEFSDIAKDPVLMINKDYIVKIEILKEKPKFSPGI